MAGQDKRCLPSMPACNGEHGGKKARYQAVVKQEPQQEEDVEEEREEGELTSHGGSPGVAAATEALVGAAPAPAPAQIDVRMDVALLHCQACFLPLKPRVFKCETGHVVCGYCRGAHGEACGRADTPCPELDAVVGATKVPCAYRDLGCDRFVVYHGAAEHKRACPWMPCSCPQPGCAFLGPPAALLDHCAAEHSRPIIQVRYGRPWTLSLPLAQRWHVVVGQEDRSVFLVSLAELGVAATAVSLLCVRPDGAAALPAAPHFWCKLSVEHPGGDKDMMVMMASAVGSSPLSAGPPVPGQGMFLAVPHELMSGDVLAISVRIDHLQPPPATATVVAAVAARAPPPPHANAIARTTARRLQ
ncbi:putative E3 ubiquitin-protein ligase SINA-like 6 [Hordeum vulgare subsp. vulgare]|uniref:putative E3 ubiquitin-protein ligase SINA-like 6 n=1 Tax=Hordeum vulgare subsp. vulgare TaxID=112509 RepID=UPI001B851B6D|nr:putative E3 ubiquitin-protein ligase SINA-like 6 [Hordeum vulgare subsp. vulgare]